MRRASGAGRAVLGEQPPAGLIRRLRSFGSPFTLFGFQTALQSCPLLLVCGCFSLLLPLAFRKDGQELSVFFVSLDRISFSLFLKIRALFRSVSGED